MKIRTDFVTNSSSSSFILINFDEKKFEKLVEGNMIIGGDTLFSICTKKFTDYDFEELEEVFNWYKEDILYEILGKGIIWRKHLEDALNRPLSYEQMKNLAPVCALQIMVKCKWYCKRYNQGQNFKNNIFSMEALEMFKSEYYVEYGLWYDDLVVFFMEHSEEVSDYLKCFDGKHMGDIMAYLFGSEYLTFYPVETDLEILETLKA